MLCRLSSLTLVVCSLSLISCAAKDDGESEASTSSGSATSGASTETGESSESGAESTTATASSESSTGDETSTDTTGGDSRHDCGGLFSNSDFTAEGTCVCDLGFDWCNPNDAEDFECCSQNSCSSGSNNMINLEGQCVCNQGYEWCDPNSVSDLNCCLSP